jgi:hypothetical protein
MRTNPRDPMNKLTSDNGRVLFETISRASDQFSSQDVINAAAMLLVNALRGAYPTRAAAAAAYDEIAAKAKTFLLDAHYDSLGRKKGIFPYDQHIHPPHFLDKDSYKKQ